MNVKGIRVMWVAMFLFPVFALRDNATVIRGQVRKNPRLRFTVPKQFQILPEYHGEVIGQGSADSGGNFVLQINRATDSLIDLFCVAPGMDTLYLGSVAQKTPEPALSLLFPCEPDTTAAGEIICPRCQKEDQVYPMTYGDPIVITRHLDTAGKIAYERTNKTQPDTNPVLHAARYYCRRDRINF